MIPQKKYWKNGKISDPSEAVVSAEDISVTRGYGIFDFFKITNGVPLYFDKHLKRFRNSAGIMRIPIHYNNMEIREAVQSIIVENQVTVGAIRLLLTGGAGSDGYSVGLPECIVSYHPFTALPPGKLEKGMSLMLVDYFRPFGKAKTINYEMGVWMQPVLKEKEFDDCLYVFNDQVYECPRANIFILNKSGSLLTPGDNVLEGITRENTMQAAARILPVEIRAFSTKELLEAREVFITSTSKSVFPVTRINEQTIGDGIPGPVTLQLRKILADLESNPVH